MIKFQTIIKIWLLLMAGVYGFIVVESASAEVTIPQDCWTQEQCVGQAGNETAKYFFKLGDSAFQTHCGGGSGSSAYGKCYVTPETTTLSVPIPDLTGGPTLTTVTQFPDYLKKIYSFFVIAIAVVAVAYLGFGGYEWIAAAGSAEQIGKAKDTIQGAIMGLLLALGSWVLLNTINSRLVEFDYMRVERIRPSALAHFCAEAEGSQQWIKVGDTTNVKVNAADTWCNFEYFSSLNANNTCMGLKCGENSYCLPKTEASGFECVDLDKVDDRCNEQEGTKESCDLFDQYVKTLQKIAPTSTISNKACRYRVDTDYVSGADWLVSDECIFTSLETVDDLENIRPESLFQYNRINCAESDVCLVDGKPRIITYSVWNEGSLINKVDVSCTNDKRAAKGTDSICIRSTQSICSDTQPEIGFFPKMIDPRIGCTNPLDCFNFMPNYYRKVDCGLYPPISGTCSSECWVHEMNYYSR